MTGSRTAGYIVEDLREDERAVVSMEAKSLLPNIDQAIDCEILDISESGAKIELKDVDILPGKFKLFVPETHSFSKCRTVWKKGNQIGVAFPKQTEIEVGLNRRPYCSLFSLRRQDARA